MDNPKYTGYYLYELTGVDEITVTHPLGLVVFSLKELMKVAKQFDVFYYDNILDADWCPTFDNPDPFEKLNEW